MTRHRAGFTLLEIILATATAAVLALALYSSLNIAMTARKAANRAVELDREAALVADLVVRDLEATLPPTGILGGPFIGDVEVVSLHAFPTAGQGSGDLPQRIELELRRDAATPSLVRRTQSNLLTPSEAELPEELLCRGVTTFTLRYYDGASWLESWDSIAADSATANILPQAVEVTLVLDREDPDGGDPRRATVVRVVPMPLGSDVAPTDDETEPAT